MKLARTLFFCLVYMTAPFAGALTTGCGGEPGEAGPPGPRGEQGPPGLDALPSPEEVDDPVLFQTYCSADNGVEFFTAFATVFVDSSVSGSCNYATVGVNESGFFIGTSCIVLGRGINWDIAQGTLTMPAGVFDAGCQ